MPILTPTIQISWEAQTPFSTFSKVRERVKMTRIPKMAEMTLLDLRPLSRDLRLSPNLPSSRITTALANHNPRETNPDSRLKKRKCHLPTANNSSSSRTRVVYGDSLGLEANLTTQLSRISKTSL
jgi:hypothetical protein